MFNLLAHGAELHDASTSEFEHLLLTPLVYGGLNLLVIAVTLLGLRWRQISPGSQLLTMMALLLTGGVVGYQFVPVVGGIMIGLGISLALVSSLLSISSGN